MDARSAEIRGFTVDRHVIPWFAYKGPRMAPIEVVRIDTYHVEELLKAFGPGVTIVGFDETQDDEEYPDEDEPVERAGPWKSGYGEYPMADEIYDLTHPQEPDEYDDRYDGPEDYDEFDDEEPNPYHGTYSEE